jgi:hypothetical protein
VRSDRDEAARPAISAEWCEKEMAETVRNQATPLEIQVTVQGSKIVQGSDQRELFTETTKTTLVFDNGAVIKLNAKVSPGQCVFLRNDASDREILCKVLESRQAGQAGYTDLEFTSYDPNFWDVPAEKSAAAEPKLPAQKIIDAAVERLVTPPNKQPSAPAPTTSAEIPLQFEQAAPAAQISDPQEKLEAAASRPVAISNTESGEPSSTDSAAPAAPTLASPLPVEVEAPHESLPVVVKDEPTDEELDWNDAKDAELVAALAAMEGKPKAKPVANEPSESHQEVSGETATEKAKQSSDAATEPKLLSMPAARTGRLSEFTTGKNPVVLGIAVAVLIAVLLGIGWYMKRGPSAPNSARPTAAATQAQPHAQPVAAQPSQTPTSASTSAASGAAPAQAAPGAQKPGAAIAQTPATTNTGNVAAAPKPATTGLLSKADQEVLGIAPHQNKKNVAANSPARIVSQAEPAIPVWAKGLDVDQVVTLDAQIDASGNLVETKPISGPRLLQPEAKRAVALWVFEPAMKDGKPVAAHLTLTVQFQK